MQQLVLNNVLRECQVFFLFVMQDDPVDSIKLARVSMSGRPFTAIIDIDKALSSSRNIRYCIDVLFLYLERFRCKEIYMFEDRQYSTFCTFCMVNMKHLSGSKSPRRV